VSVGKAQGQAQRKEGKKREKKKLHSGAGSSCAACRPVLLQKKMDESSWGGVYDDPNTQFSVPPGTDANSVVEADFYGFETESVIPGSQMYTGQYVDTADLNTAQHFWYGRLCLVFVPFPSLRVLLQVGILQPFQPSITH
jgi:hypothetical protein